jgi:small subunit ribosomal protein S16
MLTIRFTRTGKRKQPYYRLIVSEKTRDPWGKYLELLGNYNPRSKEAVLQKDRILHWLKMGAQTSATVNNLLVKEGVIEGKKQNKIKITTKRKAKMTAKQAEADKAKADKIEKEKAEKEAAEAAAKEAAEKPAEPVVEESTSAEATADEPVAEVAVPASAEATSGEEEKVEETPTEA